MSSNAISKDIQILLAHILEKPTVAPGSYINDLFPDLENIDRQEILIKTQQVIQDILEIQTSISSPTLIQRLRFSWKILRKADKSHIKKIKKKDFETLSVTMDSMKKVFHGILPTDELESIFVEKLCERVFIKQNKHAGMVKFCWEALRPKPKIKISFVDKDGDVKTKTLESVINWEIRKNRFKYVEADAERINNIQFQFLSNYIKDELFKNYYSTELEKLNNLLEVIENQINLWLDYSCLQGEAWDRCSKQEKKDIVTYFIRDNELSGEVYIEKAAVSPEDNKRISSLEKENAELIKECNRLDKKFEELSKSISPSEKPVDTEPVKPDSSTPKPNDLIDLLVGIDSKYSFDSLRAIQLGEEQSITIKNFLGHLFYNLRKKGLAIYPEEDAFELDYEHSGLYKCIGFEVPPGERVRVKVQKSGWAVIIDEKIFPVSKAAVKKDN